MTKPTPFQQKTIEAVLNAFHKGPSGRFLVADDVGLGKTVVAQGVINALMKGRKEPLTVFYICSSLAIAAQNRQKLLEVIPENQRAAAQCAVDRLTLVPAVDPPDHPRLHIYFLTPDTSLPMRRGRRRDGRMEERALIRELMKQNWPNFFTRRQIGMFRCYAGVNIWLQCLQKQKKRVKENPGLRAAFYKAVREEFGLAERRHLLPVLWELEKPDLIARMRNALAACAMEKTKPDLIILDEFQKFRDLVEYRDEDDRDAGIDRVASRIIEMIRGDRLIPPPRLLLLSATPYQLYTRRWEEAKGADHHAQFLELIEFLYGNGEKGKHRRKACEAAFADYQSEMRKGELGSEKAREARDRVRKLLMPVMSRTERASHPHGWEDFQTQLLPAPLQPEDLRIFRHLSASFSEKHKSDGPAYWTSIPLPMQTMGKSYVAWEKARVAPVGNTPWLSPGDRNKLHRPKIWPHPRLRALQELVTTDALALPWVSPSLPWWPLGSGWKNDGLGKVLLFSRFRAVPPAVSALLSYHLETVLMKGTEFTYRRLTKQRYLQPGNSRGSLLGLFHPSPWLIQATDPLAADSRGIKTIRAEMVRQVRRAVRDLGLAIRPSEEVRPLWKLIAQLENRDGGWNRVIADWRKLGSALRRADDTEGRLDRLLNQWETAAGEALNDVTQGEIKALARHALSSPGIAAGRALSRHWPAALEPEGFADTLSLCWKGLRNYLDHPLFERALKHRGSNYPEAIQRAVLEGNLEAVLDEHFWITRRLRNLEGKALAAELRDSLALRGANFGLHPLRRGEPSHFSLRCHAALPFVGLHTKEPAGMAEGRPLRSDALRKAFNTPFWPHVLSTTSVGQEGLDFHVWCRSIVHWDLCGNPTDLEQREGRIQRYGGLSVRRSIARLRGAEALRDRSGGQSPWATLAGIAESRMGDESGLCPWWICEGARINRYVFDVPASEQAARLSWLKEQRLLYRLVLGQPNQEDLLEVLRAKGEMDFGEVRGHAVGLSAWFDR